MLVRAAARRPRTTEGGARVAEEEPERLRYRMLTGPDDRTFCERVSAALAEGYRLHGSPTMAAVGDRVVVGQAVVLPAAEGTR